jgi:NAD(P)-dependent dehydrogenase (short-subunit alcohol dehydrogenase family)
VDSPMIRRLLSQHPDPAVGEAQFLARIKLGRMVSPADVAHAVIFLASDDSRMITSQTLVVDGGMLD